MSKKGNLVLVCVLVALCAAYWGMVRAEKRQKVQQAQSRRLFNFAPEDVQSLDISRIGEALVSAQRTATGEWAISLPKPSIEANQIVWDRAAKAVATLDNIRSIEGTDDLTPYGLKEPVLTVVAKKKEGEPMKFEFGALDATQAYRYTRLDGQLVFLTTVEQFHELDRSMDLLRDRRMVKLGEQGITRFEFSRFRQAKIEDGGLAAGAAEESVVVGLEKQADGKWHLVSPQAAPANQEMVEQLLKEVQYTMLNGFIDNPTAPEDYGLNPPKARLTVYSGADSEPQTVLLGSVAGSGKDKGSIYGKLATKETVFLVDANILTLLPQSPDGFREGRLFTRDASKLRSFTYKSADADITLENDQEKGWRLVQPESADTDQVAVSNFIALLKNLSGSHFPGAAPEGQGFDTPTIRVQFQFDGEEPSEILVGAPLLNAGKSYVKQDNGVVTTLNDLEVKSLTRMPYDFEKKTLIEFKPEATARVAISLDGQDYVFEKLRGKWSVTRPEGHALTTASDLDPLLLTLSSLRAVKKVADDPAQVAGTGLDTPLAVVSIGIVADGDVPTMIGPLKLGAAVPENSQHRYAVADGRAGLYCVQQAVVDEIRDTIKSVHKQ